MEKEVELYKYDNDSYVEISNKLTNDLENRIKKLMYLYDYNKVMILCIGSTKAEFDCFGPFTGSKLEKSINNPNVKIYGTQTNPINGTNIELFLSEHSNEINECLTIAIDATIAELLSLGTIIISNEGIYPGLGVGKKLPYVGDISVKVLTSKPKTGTVYPHIPEIDFTDPLIKKIATKKNAFDLYYSNFYNVLDSKDVVTISNIVSDSLATALEKIFDTEKEPIENCKKLSFKL